MSFSPIVPMGGLGGFRFLNRTRETQQATFEAQPRISRNIEAFSARIATVSSAKELVEDRQLLEVALGAFGLDEDINSKYLIERVLSEDPDNDTSLSSRFADKRYQALSDAFGFGKLGGPSTAFPGFSDKIIAQYTDRQFEVAVGEVDPDMRLALGFSRGLEEIVAKDMSNDAAWFTVMGNRPLRTVLETALGLPKSLGTLDIDQQLEVFKDRAKAKFGTNSINDIAAKDMSATVTDTFLLRSQVNALAENQLSGASVALSLLQSAPRFLL
ncbi:DUF1217 domain-containing protein [Palleronia abyssalis]|uniref:Flagellar protein n=1 Tax=Palleronia abyssalis TaxID=1501240 RepID=A0A2R8BWU7_9RHOB|nr:DUF1217 domain-containing protein [Palleronia abyssalis]SPJ24634.1 hypothetical protein PAA8504_02471 [Palleronia abyssalis]